MRILVFDANVDFARRATNFIQENVRGSAAEMASNIFILRKRLREAEWDVVLADVAAAASMDAVIDELSRLHCPVIVWSSLGTLHERRECVEKFKLIAKPRTPGELSKALDNVVATA